MQRVAAQHRHRLTSPAGRPDAGPWIVALALGASLACRSAAQTPVSAPQASVAASAVTEISIERRCTGCPEESRVTLRRDGTAARTLFGRARSGTTDRSFTGTIAPEMFQQLADRVVAEGFFQLAAEYRDPQIADGSWTITTVVAGAERKSVLDRDGRAPAALRRLQARIDEVNAAMTWRE